MKIILKTIDDVIRGAVLTPPTEFPTESFKFASLEFVRKNCNDYVNYVLDHMIPVGDRKHILVDVKVHHLDEGTTPALKFWHMDGVSNPLNPAREERHQIFVSGNECLTQFLAEEKVIEIEPDEHVYFDKHLEGVRSASIEGNRVYSYGRIVHRASPALAKHIRLLVRLTETDLIAPQNRLFNVTYR